MIRELEQVKIAIKPEFVREIVLLFIYCFLNKFRI